MFAQGGFPTNSAPVLFGNNQNAGAFGSTPQALPTSGVFVNPITQATSPFMQQPTGQAQPASTNNIGQTNTFGPSECPCGFSSKTVPFLFGTNQNASSSTQPSGSTPTFGQALPVSGVFGTPITQSRNPFLQRPGWCGNSTHNCSATRLYGSTTASVIGQAIPASSGGFGTAQTTSLFGQQPTAHTTSLFGQQPTAQATTLFGQQPTAQTTSLFGQQPTAQATSLFGQQPTAQTQSKFANVFGQTNTSSAGLSGSSDGFPSNTGPGWCGDSSYNCIGKLFIPTTSSVIEQAKPVSGGFGTAQTTSFFGQKPTAQPTILFGQQPTAQTTSLFGLQPTAQTTNLFGQQPTAQTQSKFANVFGQTNTSSPGLSGSSGGSTKESSANTGTGKARFIAVIGTDTMLRYGISQTVNTKYHCITIMKEYDCKSIEELRLEDYMANRKGPQQVGKCFAEVTADTMEPQSVSSTGSHPKGEKALKMIELLDVVCEIYKADDQPRANKYSAFGNNVAYKLEEIESLDNNQRIIAEKLINEVISLGQLGKLSKHNRISDESKYIFS